MTIEEKDAYIAKHLMKLEKDTLRFMVADLTAQLSTLTAANAKLREALEGLLDDIEGLADESHGVYGLHLNGDYSPWSELLEGGRFERLSHISIAREALKEGADAIPS